MWLNKNKSTNAIGRICPIKLSYCCSRDVQTPPKQRNQTNFSLTGYRNRFVMLHKQRRISLTKWPQHTRALSDSAPPDRKRRMKSNTVVFRHFLVYFFCSFPTLVNKQSHALQKTPKLSCLDRLTKRKKKCLFFFFFYLILRVRCFKVSVSDRRCFFGEVIVTCRYPKTPKKALIPSYDT